MAITKYVAASAPYNHQTFDDAQGFIAGANGVLTGGEVTTSASLVTVQPLSWIQEGLIVNSDGVLTATLPTNILVPYFLAVTTSSPIDILDEVITPTFVQRPEDVDSATVLVAEWDGQEWRQLPYLQLTEINEAAATAAVKGQMAGVASGLDMTQDGSNVYVQPGSAYPTDGKLIVKQDSVTLPKVAADPNGLDRIDQIVLRKPADDPSRIATIEYLVGPTFSDAGGIQVFTPNQVSSVTSSGPKVVNDPSNDNLYIFYLESNTLKFRYANDTLSSISAAQTLAAGVSSFDAIQTPDGFLDIVYTSGDVLYYGRFTTLGAVVYATNPIYSAGGILINPKIVTVYANGSYDIHIVVQATVSVGHNQIGYVRLNTVNTVITGFQVLVDLSAQLANPSLDKDDNDSILYLAFENQTVQTVYLAEYDASTATAVTPPTATVEPFELQGNTYNLDTASLALATGATNPKVKRMANKQTYVFWRHVNGVSSYGVAVYNVNYLADFGYTALMQHLYTPGENVDEYKVAVDELDTAYLILREQGLVGSATLRLSTLTAGNATEIQASLGTDINTVYTSLGALIQSYSDSSPATWITKQSATTAVSLRDNYIPPSDIYLGKYRTSDGYLSVAGTALEEDPSIRRLYEFNNLYAATATASWGGSATHLLTVVSALSVNFLDRLATYTIPAGSVNIPDGSVCYVLVPDEDESQNLTFIVEKFGHGALDRLGRTALPMFWSVAGVLYTKFAPYRLDAGGETVVLGEPLSQAAQEWLGLPSFTPDPSNHAYSSTNYIHQSDDYNTAIGELDTAIAEVEGDVEAFFASLQLIPHPTIHSRVIVNPSDTTLINGEVRSQILQSLIVNFTGAQLDFGTPDAGNIYASDGITLIGTFTMPSIATSQWRWFAVAGAVGSIASDNRINIMINANAATADGSTQNLAPRPFFNGFPIGAVAVQALGGGAIATIAYTNIVLAGTNQGSGVTGIPDTAQETAVYSGTPGHYTISQTPLDPASTWVFVDGLIQTYNVAWTITGNAITFLAGYIPDPATQKVTVSYIVMGTETLDGDQEVPAGVIDGVNDTFTLSAQPPNRTSVWVFLNGKIQPTSAWSFYQTPSITQVIFTVPPPMASKVYVTFLFPLGSGGGGGGSIIGADNVGAGSGVYYGEASGVLEFKSLQQGTGITVVDNGLGTITISATGGGGGIEVHGSRVSPESIDPTVGIYPTTAVDQVWWVIPSFAGPQQITASPMIQAGTAVGQRLTLKGVSPANYLITEDVDDVAGSGLDQNGPCNITDQNAIQYQWDGTYWSENFRRE